MADSIAAPLAIDPKQIVMQVGESLQIGTDVTISRGGVDLSRQCRVSASLPGVVRYRPETHSLLAVAPGVTPVAFASGDKVVDATVEVVPAKAAVGEVVCEPAGSVLAPGQAQEVRVYAISPDGRRTDRTDSAVLTSSDPGRVAVRGNLACAVAPGAAKITATLPGSDRSGSAAVTVNDEKLDELIVDPAGLTMSVGDREHLRVLGRSPSGTHELYSQPDLAATVGGGNPDAVRVSGAIQVEAVSPGQAEITLRWRDALSRSVPVTVTADRLAKLTIEPRIMTIQPGDRIVYQVMGTKGGQRRLLGPDDGLSLSVAQPEVGQLVEGMSVRGAKPGQTSVVARLGSEQAEASLTVAPAGDESVVLYDHLHHRIDRLAGRERIITGDDVILGPWIVGDGQVVAGRGWVDVGPGGVVARPVTVETPGVEVAPPAVAVSGKRFAAVNMRLNEGEADFNVSVEVTPGESEGKLEYRLYQAGQEPPASWQAVEQSASGPQAVLRSPKMPYRGPSADYRLVIESRDAAGKTEQYPLSFHLVPKLERTDEGNKDK